MDFQELQNVCQQFFGKVVHTPNILIGVDFLVVNKFDFFQ